MTRFSRGGEHLPSLALSYSRLIVRAFASHEVVLEFRQSKLLPALRLPQESPALKGTEGRGLAIQRSDCAISTYILKTISPLAGMTLFPSLSPAR